MFAFAMLALVLAVFHRRGRAFWFPLFFCCLILSGCTVGNVMIRPEFHYSHGRGPQRHPFGPRYTIDPANCEATSCQ